MDLENYEYILLVYNRLYFVTFVTCFFKNWQKIECFFVVWAQKSPAIFFDRALDKLLSFGIIQASLILLLLYSQFWINCLCLAISMCVCIFGNYLRFVRCVWLPGRRPRLLLLQQGTICFFGWVVLFLWMGMLRVEQWSLVYLLRWHAFSLWWEIVFFLFWVWFPRILLVYSLFYFFTCMILMDFPFLNWFHCFNSVFFCCSAISFICYICLVLRSPESATSISGSNHILHSRSVPFLPTCTWALFSLKSVFQNKNIHVIVDVIYNNTFGLWLQI